MTPQNVTQYSFRRSSSRKLLTQKALLYESVSWLGVRDDFRNWLICAV